MGEHLGSSRLADKIAATGNVETPPGDKTRQLKLGKGAQVRQTDHQAHNDSVIEQSLKTCAL